MSNSTKARVLIVGGGFAGTKAALELASEKECHVTLLSDHSHFRYYPALYHAATGGKRAGSRIRLSNILDESKMTFIRATASKLDREHKHVITSDQQKISYDVLILALGNVTNYFGIQGLSEYSYGIKSHEEIDRFKRHIHEQLNEEGRPDENYVIVGGGPTGIELAGALPGYLREVIKKHGLPERQKLHIELIEAAPHLLPRSPKKISQAVERRLKQLGIKVLTDTKVGGETRDTLKADDRTLKSHTVIWTAGVTNNPFFTDNKFTITERGKVEVDPYLQAEPNIFVLGDNANTPFSGMAQTALYDAEFVACNLRRALHGRRPQQYTPKKPVSVIPVGPHWAAVEWGPAHFAGCFGGMLHFFVDLIGFHDLESWPKAGEQWIRSLGEEELACPDCAKRTGRR